MAVDLDAAKAARREAKGEGPTVVFGGETFTLPVEMPFEIVEELGRLQSAGEDGALAGQAVLSVVRLLLGEQYKAFMAHRPSMDDLTELANGAMREYGTGRGESLASKRSSGNTTGRSRPTSVRSTA